MSAKITIRRTTTKYQVTGCRQDRPPIGQFKFPGPDFFSGIYIPGLNFANMISPFNNTGTHIGNAGKTLAGTIFSLHAFPRRTVVVISWNIQQASLWTVSSWHPVLATGE